MMSSKQWYIYAGLIGSCSGLCDPTNVMPKLHQDPNCTKPISAELPMLEALYNYTAVECVKLVNGSISKSACQTSNL